MSGCPKYGGGHYYGPNEPEMPWLWRTLVVLVLANVVAMLWSVFR